MQELVGTLESELRMKLNTSGAHKVGQQQQKVFFFFPFWVLYHGLLSH